MRDEDATLRREDFGDATHGSTQHGHAAGEGFHNHTGQVLEVGEQHEKVGILVGFSDLGGGFFAVENDAVRNVVFFYKCLELRGFVVVDDVQFEVVALLVKSFNGSQNAAEVFGFVTQSGNVEDALFCSVLASPKRNISVFTKL